MNLPNKISIFRVLLVPVLVFVFLFPFEAYGIEIAIYTLNGVDISLINIILLIIFTVASITDFLDGHIARKNNLITSFGKFIDPIADKLLVNTLFILLATTGTISVVPVLIMIWRDTMVDAMRMMCANKGKVVAAGMSGKIKTVLQMFTIIFLLLNNIPFEFIHIPFATILLWSSAIVSIYSGVVYFIQSKDVIMESM